MITLMGFNIKETPILMGLGIVWTANAPELIVLPPLEIGITPEFEIVHLEE